MMNITSQNGSKPPLHSLASLPKENKSTSDVSKCYHLITNNTQYIHQHTSKSKNKYALKRPKPDIQAYTVCATDHDSSTDSSLFSYTSEYSSETSQNLSGYVKLNYKQHEYYKFLHNKPSR